MLVCMHHHGDQWVNCKCNYDGFGYRFKVPPTVL